MNEELKVIISAEISKLKQGVSDATKELGNFDKHKEKVNGNIKKLGNGIKTAMAAGAAGIVATGTAMYKFSEKTAATADNIDKMSQRLGLSREGFQTLDYVLSQSGVDINNFRTGMKSLTANMDKVSEGNETAIDNFEKLGLSVYDSNGKLKSQEQMLNEMIPAFQNMENSTEKSRLAQEMFGKQGQEIMPLLNGEAGSYEKLTQKAKDLGIVLGDDVIDSGVEFTDTLDTMKRSVGTIGNKLGGSLLPILTNVMNYVIKHTDDIQNAIEKTVEVVGNIVEFATNHKGLLIAIGTVIGVITAAITAYNIVAAIQTAMEAAEVTTLGSLIAVKLADAAATMVALAPYVLIVAAIAAVIAIIVVCIKHFDKIKEFFKKAVDSMKTKADDMKNSIKNKFNDMKTGVVNKVNDLKTKITEKFNALKEKITSPVEKAKEKIKNIVDKIKGIFNFKWSLPKLKIPKITVSGGVAPFGIGGKGSLPKFSIKWNARGGVFDEPTVFGYNGSLQGLGERGAEAVVPLENNTKWMNVLADKLGRELIQSGNIGDGSINISLQVGSSTFGNACIKSINEAQKQKGAILLNI